MHSNLRILAALLCLLFLSVTMASAESALQNGTEPQVSAVAAKTSAHALRIAAGDLLELTVFDTPEISGKLRVSENGTIGLPIAGDLYVSGMTAEQTAAAVESTLRERDILKTPYVTVFISEYATQGVTVLGEVKTPGIYPLLGSHGLLDIISAAGGVTPTAGKAITVTRKTDPEHPLTVQVQTKPGGNAEADIDIQPGDSVSVSRSGVVYVVGDVLRPGGFLIENNDKLMVLQAIALAQGTNRTAALNNAKLIRKSPNGPLEMAVPLKRILANKSADMALEDGDILFVPTSTGKAILAGAVSTVPSISSAIIYRGL
jgi:polysaccharide export outer membrane protein